MPLKNKEKETSFTNELSISLDKLVYLEEPCRAGKISCYSHLNEDQHFR